MIEYVLEIDMGLTRKDRLFTPEQSIKNVAQRSNRPPQVKQLLLDQEYFFNDRGAPFSEYRVLQIVHPLADDVEKREVVINDCIDKQVSQQSGARFRSIEPFLPESARGGDSADRA